MLRLRVRSAIAITALGAGLGGCFFDASAFDGAAGAFSSSTTGAGASDTTTSHGGSAGAFPVGGTTPSGGSGGAPEGGALPVTPADDCPGAGVDVPPYSKVLIEGDTSDANDEFGNPICGGGGVPDLVYKVIPQESGVMSVSLTPLDNFNGFFELRTICMSNDSEVQCGLAANYKVEKDTAFFVIVDGSTGDPGKLNIGRFQLRLFLNSCGNGKLETAGEECDDGNKAEDDTCTNDCKVRCTGKGSMSNDFILYTHPQTHHCYLQSYGPNSDWKAAEDDCVAWGGHLAALTPILEKNDLQGIVGQTFEDVWIGGNDRDLDGTYVWTTKDPWEYPGGQPPWANGEPNGGMGENCVEIYQNGRINDDNCSSKQNWLCERAPAGSKPP